MNATAVTPVENTGFLTALDLYMKAILFKGLPLPEGKVIEESSGRVTLNIKKYRLKEELLAKLASAGIYDEPIALAHEIFTLIDHNPQAEPLSGWRASNYWNFRYRVEETKELGEIALDPLDVTLYLKFSLRQEKEGGIDITTGTIGTIMGPTDLLPNLRMLRVLVEGDTEVPSVIHELAASEGTLTVTWKDLGLEGLKTMHALFNEDFAKGSEVV